MISRVVRLSQAQRQGFIENCFEINASSGRFAQLVINEDADIFHPAWMRSRHQAQVPSRVPQADLWAT